MIIAGIQLVIYVSNIQTINKLTFLAKSSVSELDAMQKLAQMSYDIDNMMKLSANLKINSKIILLGVFYKKSTWTCLAPEKITYYKKLIKKYNQLIYQEIIKTDAFKKSAPPIIKMRLAQIWVSNNLHLDICTAMLDSVSVDGLKHDDYKIEYFIEQARLAEKLKKYDLYAKYLEKALEFNSNPNTFFIESTISENNKNWLMSSKCMEKYLELTYGKNWLSVIKKNNNDEDALHIASLWECADIKLETMEALLKHFSNEEQNLDAGNQLTYFWAKKDKKLLEAELLIKQIIDKSPKEHIYIDTLGWILYKQKKYDESLEQLKKALKLAPDNDEILWHLGDVYLALGKTKKAKEQWQKALGLTKDEELKKKIEEKLKTVNR